MLSRKNKCFVSQNTDCYNEIRPRFVNNETSISFRNLCSRFCPWSVNDMSINIAFCILSYSALIFPWQHLFEFINYIDNWWFATNINDIKNNKYNRKYLLYQQNILCFIIPESLLTGLLLQKWKRYVILRNVTLSKCHNVPNI